MTFWLTGVVLPSGFQLAFDSPLRMFLSRSLSATSWEVQPAWHVNSGARSPSRSESEGCRSSCVGQRAWPYLPCHVPPRAGVIERAFLHRRLLWITEKGQACLGSSSCPRAEWK
jgi:hypothetical protein